MPSDVHVLPTDDLREHSETRDCWCIPDVLPLDHWDRLDGARVVVHHALDGRELIEAHGVQ